MEHEATSKSIEGITDLVVVAPIQDGFIEAYENVTYATRLRVVAEALNQIRIAAREHEEITPFSDVTERILTLLDFRVGIIDQDLVALPTRKRENEADDQGFDGGPKSRRFLYLTATFDGAWEPYMRLIWSPLGPFLDLLFCNCQGYVTASEHSFEEYAQWVRDNQMESAIFYSTTGLTVRDHLYLSRLEYLQRSQSIADAERSIARLTMPQPELVAAAERRKAIVDVVAGDPRQYGRIHEQALEVLTVLYRLADYYPPEWLTGRQNGLGEEGHYLARVARDLLLGWDELIPKTPGPLLDQWNALVAPAYHDPLHWFETGKAYLEGLDSEERDRLPSDPVFDPSEVQGGVLSPPGNREQPARYGALLLMTVTDAAVARTFISRDLEVWFEDQPRTGENGPFLRTIGFTSDGLRRIGVETGVLNRFPKEFRHGMEARSGLIGDFRENHPRDWRLPERNWPPAPDGHCRPPVDMSEVDVVVQLRTATGSAEDLAAEARRLAALAAPGLATLSIQAMSSHYEADGSFIDHFGFHDGISQPKPTPELDATAPRQRDQVRLGEVLLGYANDRGDSAPVPFASETGDMLWRGELRATAREYQLDGTFLVVRKLEQHVESFDRFISEEVARINRDDPSLPSPMTEERLKALMLGRNPNGRPLQTTASSDPNDFDYRGDPDGLVCPFAAHVRRTNPRDAFQGRAAPRIVRRGMSFDDRDTKGAGARGLIFMAYNASISEQFETIQRWVNGGNSTFVASAHADPLMGVSPKTGALSKQARSFRFIEGDQVIRVSMPAPFVSLHWGIYLFVPSRTALNEFAGLKGSYRPMEEARETTGQEVITRLDQLKDDEARNEWKRLLEDFDTKDPSERDITPDMWSAIRWNYGGSLRLNYGLNLAEDWDHPPVVAKQSVVLSASYAHVSQVLSDWKAFTTEEQLRRIESNSGPIYVTQQPDDVYRNADLRGKYNYRDESERTNRILMQYGEEDGFAAGYEAARSVLAAARSLAVATGRGYFEIELRRQFLLPALGALCRSWYGLPDGIHMHEGAWLWEPPAGRAPPGARCPGDFLSPSRNAFYPRPGEAVGSFAAEHGAAILAASRAFVGAHRPSGGAGTGSIAREMFAAIGDDEVLARNLVGTMVGAVPPMDGNLRGILLEWLTERTLWRHQAALNRATEEAPEAEPAPAALAVLRGPVSQAMCKRPAPDLLYRTATGSQLEGQPVVLRARGEDRSKDIHFRERDLVVVSLVSAAQRSLLNDRTPDGDVSIVFGGKRRAAYQPEPRDRHHPVHACPAQKMAMGAIIGILAALLQAGRIQALPASLIVRVSDWP